MDLSIIAKIWNIIVTSNTFNFILFILAFAWIFKKINLKGLIASLHEKVVKLLNEAKANKEEAENKLKNAQKAVENLGEELKIITEEATKIAEVISKKILNEAE